MRMAWQSIAAILFVSGATSPALAASRGDDVAQVIAECGASDLADAAVGPCLERVRVVDETNPSPQLQSLEAQLEERKSGKHAKSAAQRADPSPSTGQPRSFEADGSAPGMFDKSVEVPSRPVMGEVGEDAPPPDKDLRSPGAGPEQIDHGGVVSDSAPRDVPDFGSGNAVFGADVDDEPPVEDPPDQAPRTDDPQ